MAHDAASCADGASRKRPHLTIRYEGLDQEDDFPIAYQDFDEEDEKRPRQDYEDGSDTDEETNPKKMPTYRVLEFSRRTDSFSNESIGSEPSNQDKFASILENGYGAYGHPFFNRYGKKADGIYCRYTLEGTLVIVIWTKNIVNISPRLRKALMEFTQHGEWGGPAIVFEITMTGYGGDPLIEPGVPRPEEFIKALPGFVQWVLELNGADKLNEADKQKFVENAIVLHLDPIIEYTDKRTGEHHNRMALYLYDVLSVAYEEGIRVVHISGFQQEKAWKKHISKMLRRAGLPEFSTAFNDDGHYAAQWLKTNLTPVLEKIENPGDPLKIEICTGSPEARRLYPRLRLGACLSHKRLRVVCALRGIEAPPKQRSKAETGKGEKRGAQCLCDVGDRRDVGNWRCSHDCVYCFAQHKDGRPNSDFDF